MPENEVLFSKLDSKIKRGLDYYGVLGLTKGATIDEIKDAYKKLSVQYNPSRHPDCSDEKMETLFCLIGEAYEALSEPFRRALYDQFGEECLKKGIMTPIGWFPPWQYHGSPLQTFKNFHGSGNPFADVINCMREMVCMMKSSGDIVKEKQPSIEMDLELTLEEVYFGAWKKVKIRRRAFNEDQITTREEEKVICVQIKPGTPEGTQFIYKNVGDEGLQVEPGDLIITTKDIPHPRFKRDGVNLLMDIRLDLHRSLGHLTIELFTIDCRTIRFAITELIDPGYTKVVPDEGMPYYEDNLVKGDLYLKFDINFPQQLTEKARRKMIEALMDTGSDEEEDMPDDLEERLRAAERAREAALQGEGGEGGPPKLVCTDYQDINKIKGLYKL